MKKLILFLVTLLSSVTLSSYSVLPTDHLLGSRYGTPPEEALFVFSNGQSNAVGYDVMERLANDDYNYKGISTGYPTQRSGQEQYPMSGVVPGVFIYFKTDDPADDQSLDDGSWQPLELGVNNCQNSGDFNGIGPDLSMCIKLHEYTGKDIYLIKCAYPGTALASSVTPTNPPGNWNNTNREIFINYFVKPALADFRAANPTIRPRLLAFNWWQGEHDALNSISTAGYKVHHNTLAAYWEEEVLGQFVTTTTQLPIWNLTKLRFRENAAEDDINDALTELVAEHSRYYLVDCSPYPQTEELTADEAAPIAVSTVGNNSAGREDDNHNSYIAQLAVGELWAQNIIDAGLVTSASIGTRHGNAPRRIRSIDPTWKSCYSPALYRAEQLAKAA